MARKVFISSDMSIDETISDIAELDQLAALIWPWILTYFDDWGRAKASPREIKNSVFPANDLVSIESIGKSLKIYDGRLVRLYEVEGKPYMCIDPDKWFKYQTHIRSEKRDNDRSKHPAPPAIDSAQVRADARECAQIADNLTNCIPSPSPSLSLSNTKQLQQQDQSVVVVLHNPFKLYESEGFGTISSVTMQDLQNLIDDYSERWVCEAMRIAIRSGKRTIRFVNGVLKNWRADGIDNPWNDGDKPSPPKMTEEERLRMERERPNERPIVNL